MAIGSGTAARNIGIWSWTQADEAAKKGQGLIDQGRDAALISLGKHFGQAREDLMPWYDSGKDALGVYRGSVGLDGQAGQDAATAAFREAPGYRYAVDQATDAVARKASATGALGSGNTMQAISDRAQGMADQGYKDWQAQILGLSDRGQQAAGALATLGQNRGTAEAGVHTGLTGLSLDNLWRGTTTGINAVTGAQKQATDNVNSGASLWANVIGSGLKLITGTNLLGFGG